MNEIHYLTPTSSDLQLPLYATGAGHWDSQEAVHRTDGFPDYQWSLALQGEGELTIGRRVYRVKAGDGFLLPPHIGHAYRTVREPWEVYWITFDGHGVDGMLKLAGLSAAGPYRLEETRSVTPYMEQLVRMARTQPPGHGAESSKLLYGLLLELRKQAAGGGAAAHQMNERLQPVLAYIEANYSRKLTLPELARLIHVTPQHLCLLFKRIFDMRPMEYVNRTRMNKAKAFMLQHPQAKQHETALAVGFENPAYFNAMFKRITGMSPGAFMKRHRA